MALRALYAVGIKVNGRDRIVGKVLEWDGKLIFYRTPYKDAVLVKWDALSFDRSVAEHLVEEKVVDIHYEDQGAVYVCSLDYFMRYSIEGDHGELPQLYLPLDAWVKKPKYDVPWTQKVEWLVPPAPHWEPIAPPVPEPEPEPGPQQRLEI